MAFFNLHFTLIFEHVRCRFHLIYWFKPRGNCNHCLENGHLQTRCFKTGHFEMLRFPSEVGFNLFTLIYCVENAFNPTSEVQNIENRVFQNAPFANAPFANGCFPNGDYSCLWALSENWI